MMRSAVGGLLLLCIVTLGGCQAFYEGFKMGRSEDCYRLAYPEQEQCLQQVAGSYDEYEKERMVRQGKKDLP
ncbi:MAG: hypothetical protein OEL83_20610 [Desulforhopalus sp.]|nr:hypothetical protein [Desulforhopalus sp.]